MLEARKHPSKGHCILILITRIQLSLSVDGPHVRLVETADRQTDDRRQTNAYLGQAGPSN